MKHLMNLTIKKIIVYAGIVLVCSIPAYYLVISLIWQFEMNEHNIVLTDEAARHDRYVIITAVTALTSLFFIFLLGGSILLNRSVSRRLWQPFYESLAKIRNFDLTSRQQVIFDQTNIFEFAELNVSLEKLISGNISAYNQQKEFTDNASHELQTPLAIVQSKLELLLQNSSLTDAQYNSIEDALHALARVSRINKNLLILAKIENSQFIEKERIDFSALLHETVTLFKNYSDNKKIELQLNIIHGKMVEGNKILIEILINNLITNAIRHSSDHKKIIIKLTNDHLVIKNEGISPLQAEQLFNRFATATSENPGTGLGLALVKQISARYNWKPGYHFDHGFHVFSIEF